MSEQREPYYTVPGQPARRLTTARCWLEDAERLEMIRKHLVVQAGGENRTIADAVAAALDAWDSAAAKREIARIDAKIS